MSATVDTPSIVAAAAAKQEDVIPPFTAEEALAMTYTDELSVERVVTATVPEAFEKFHEYVWKRCAGVGPASWTQIIEEGDVKTLAGETRTAVGITKEKILRTIPNEEIMYTVVAGPVPLKNHVGFVRFYPVGNDKTKIVWLVKYTPNFGFGLAIKTLMKGVFALFLHNLERELTSSAPSTSPALVMATPKEALDFESQKFTDSTSVERVLSGPLPLVFKTFREVAWLRTGSLGPASWTTIIEQGDAETHVGEVRKAAGIMQEKILRVVENELIVYTVVRGPMPVHNHLGSVVFTPVGDDKTKVTWSVQFTPVKGTSLATKAICQAVFPIFLHGVESELLAMKKQ